MSDKSEYGLKWWKSLSDEQRAKELEHRFAAGESNTKIAEHYSITSGMVAGQRHKRNKLLHPERYDEKGKPKQDGRRRSEARAAAAKKPPPKAQNPRLMLHRIKERRKAPEKNPPKRPRSSMMARTFDEFRPPTERRGEPKRPKRAVPVRSVEAAAQPERSRRRALERSRAFPTSEESGLPIDVLRDIEKAFYKD
ncbi:MAG TPA: hypothetical protein VG934_02700 [Candidatus Paceibacterota bacterium]|nr:hypothetical protein [Candidatus Paceibacterota bacterium]